MGEVARITEDKERRRATSEVLKRSLGSSYDHQVFRTVYAEMLVSSPKHVPKSPTKSRKEQSSEEEEEEEEEDDDEPPPSKRQWKKAAETEFAHKSKKHQMR